MISRILTIGLSLVCMSLITARAEALTRTVCAELHFRDQRDPVNCVNQFQPGVRRPCAATFGQDVDHFGAVVELWDKDPDGSDERIGRFLYNSAGFSCWQFEWEANSVANSENEANPDVYIKYVFETWDSGIRRSVVAKTSTGGTPTPVSFRSFVANECTSSSPACWINPNGFLLVNPTLDTDISRRANALDSAQHALEVFAGIMTHHVNMRLPASCSNNESCSTSRSEIRVTSSTAFSGFRVAHEVGHSIHFQQLGIDSMTKDYGLDNTWLPESDENDKVATIEGVAEYIGVASWFSGSVAGSRPAINGMNFEQVKSNCADSDRGHALQVARAFWDMNDVDNEDGDTESWPPSILISAYRLFPSGTGDRQNAEAGKHGFNVKDYVANTNTAMYFSSMGQFDTMVNHNCLQAQENN